MNEFLEQFLIEGRELIEQATADLLELEQAPGNRERLAGAFRAFHTLKGAAGIVDFSAMNRALHAVEDTLAAVRAGERTIGPALVTDCLSSLDQVSAWLRVIESTGEFPMGAEADADRIVAKFTATPAAPETILEDGGAVDRARRLIEAQILLVGESGPGEAGRIASALKVAVNTLTRLGRHDVARRVSSAALDARGADAARATLREALDAVSAGEDVGPRAGERATRTLRIDVARVDALVKLTGELTTVKNAIGHVTEKARTSGDLRGVVDLMREHHATLDRLVSELQRSVLNVRVLPMGQVFQRFPRLVREMSTQAEKPARLITEGEDTEADKAIVEALFEPMLHIVRNALDHGIEEASERQARGKPAVAKIVLRALRAGEHVIVEVEDDGGGIDIARVRELAVARSVASADAVAAMDDAAAAYLIFAPGFSTATTVTALSGRGVGMDAVKEAISNLGGTVEVSTRLGQGTIVRLLLPFTLMMTRVMTVHAGGQAFGIPFDAIVETVRAPRDRISSIGAARAFVFRDRTIPVIDLAETLAGRTAAPDRPSDATLVVTSVGGELSAFEIDAAGTTLDVMLSPLDGLLAGVRGIAGATLMGDGQVLIILDLQALAE